jgi:hypothetical protein
VNDLRVLSPRSYISTFLSSAPSSIQLPYISYRPHTNISDLQSESLAEQVSRRCGHVIQKPGVVETALMKVGLGSWWGKPKKMHGAGKAKGRVHCVHVNHGTNATEMLGEYTRYSKRGYANTRPSKIIRSTIASGTSLPTPARISLSFSAHLPRQARFNTVGAHFPLLPHPRGRLRRNVPREASSRATPSSLLGW